MDKRLLDETENHRNYIDYPEVEILISNCCGCPCCCKVAYFPIQNLTFIGHWRKNLAIPIIVGIFYFVTISCYFVDTYNTFPNLTYLILSYFFTSFSFICFIIGYYAIIIKGPGYVPYNWFETHKTKYTWEESMRNIAIYNDQVKFAQSSVDRPRRSCFSKEARRFVLRADHYCKLGKSWIGLKNYRYFILTCFYCFLFSFSIVLSRYWLFTGIYRFYKTERNNSRNVQDLNYVKFHQSNAFVNKYSNKNNLFNGTKKFKFQIWYAFGILTTLIACFYGIYSLFTFFSALHNLARNVTTYELMTKNDASIWNHGCIRNFEEVCGSKKCLLFWPFPFICLETIENGFYSEVWNTVNNNLDSESTTSKYQTMDSLY